MQKRKNSNKIDCSTATASFGQGIMATPLQMATAFSTIVNGGKLMRPYIVEGAVMLMAAWSGQSRKNQAGVKRRSGFADQWNVS